MYLKTGETKTVETVIDKYRLKAVLENTERVTPDGEITFFIGDSQPDNNPDTLIVHLK